MTLRSPDLGQKRDERPTLLGGQEPPDEALQLLAMRNGGDG